MIIGILQFFWIRQYPSICAFIILIIAGLSTLSFVGERDPFENNKFKSYQLKEIFQTYYAKEYFV